MSVLAIRRETVASGIADALRDVLLSGAIAPGTPVSAAALADRTGAARATVREALAELAQDGLVVHSLHRGMEVARITREDLRDIYRARRAFELAGLEALLRHAPVDASWLRAAAARMGEAAVADDRRAAVEADMAFHLALVAAARSRRLIATARNALMELRLVLSVADRLAADLPALVADHQRLVDIFEGGQPQEATAALEDHLARGEAMARAAACGPG
jgi:DNA-binding GntR family transcriptional regulator